MGCKMGDMGDDFRAMKEHKQKARAKAEPRVLENAKKDLEAKGWRVWDNDPWSFDVQAPNGSYFKFWPFKGYFQQVGGSKHGHGIKNLMEVGE